MKPSNLIIISSDQHSKYMLGSYGNEKIKTPNLDKLARQGVKFQNAYCNSPICVPSRSSMAIGDYASKHGYWDNAHAYAGKEKSWGGRLAEEGLTATTIGKLHFQDDSPETGFTDQRIPMHIKNGVGDVYGSIRDKEITRPQFRDAITNAGVGETDYQAYDREIARQAAEFIEAASKNPEKPFTLYVGFITPHFPLVIDQKYFDLYPDKESLQRPIQFGKDEWAQHPVINDYRRYCCTEDISEDEAWNAIRAYYALCSFMDEQVGVVLDALNNSSLADNTYVIYTSDHGDTMGDHGIYYKSTMYEGSAGVPMIISGPDLPKGTTCNTNVSLLDIYPTVLECANIITDGYDKSLPGSSLLPFARGKEEPERVVCSEYYSQGVYTASFLLKKGKYKYIYYVNERPQLFDLENDPNECYDLALEVQNKPILQEMEAELRKILNPEALEIESKKAQEELLKKHGGREEFLRTFKPALFSPIPKL